MELLKLIVLLKLLAMLLLLCVRTICRAVVQRSEDVRIEIVIALFAIGLGWLKVVTLPPSAGSGAAGKLIAATDGMPRRRLV
jgi:hypothetical protein